MSRAMASAWGWCSGAGAVVEVRVVLAGLGGVLGPGRQLAEAVECLRLAEPVAEVTEQGQGLLVAGGCGRVVPGFLLYEAKVVEGQGLAEHVAEAAEER